MIRFLLVSAIFMLTCSCATVGKMPHVPNERCLTLMEVEVTVSGDFSERQAWHKDLMFECMNKTAHPYPRLLQMLDSMQKLSAQMITQRGATCRRADSLTHTTKKKELESRLNSVYDKGRAEILQTKAAYIERTVAYDSLLEAEGIRKLTQEEYANSLLEKLITWEDSIEFQGREIASCRLGLKQSGWEKRSSNYLETYAFLSQMEYLHKQSMSKITSIGNQQSRFSVTRSDEAFYLGPYLFQRDDYLASEQLLADLRELMQSFEAERIKFEQKLTELMVK